MTQTTQKILEEIKSLSPIERVELIDKIHQTFDQEIDHEVEKTWIEESEGRISEYKKGNIKTVSSEEVFERIKKEEL